MKMLINKNASAEKEVVRIHWERDAETFNLLSLQTGEELTAHPAFSLPVFRDSDAWYRRMLPGDAGKELGLLKEVYTKGKGKIRYSMLGLDGSEWLVTESMELKVPRGEGKGIIQGKWICEKK
ncbi:hypothetical protein EDD80_10398 [Anseongella ginsenosidimutans]|uniref:Uncharacterized protein n=1 Tax=Anseongella ginsenosidimutans TaxID=496056 RepID=A0A4R3KSP1_9SPHI|nr:hypothetical protein [Anseongella ginsenosidimutans]TCS88236.1 hypothetical protein EDD80_10398 [Anseongella ginsenosidimutans]